MLLPGPVGPNAVPSCISNCSSAFPRKKFKFFNVTPPPSCYEGSPQPCTYDGNRYWTATGKNPGPQPATPCPDGWLFHRKNCWVRYSDLPYWVRMLDSSPATQLFNLPRWVGTLGSPPDTQLIRLTHQLLTTNNITLASNRWTYLKAEWMKAPQVDAVPVNFTQESDLLNCTNPGET